MWQGGGLGYGQAWQNVAASRSNGFPYLNGTGKPIFITASATNAPGSSSAIWATVDGMVLAYDHAQDNRMGAIWVVVPTGSTYSVTWNETFSLTTWAELR